MVVAPLVVLCLVGQNPDEADQKLFKGAKAAAREWRSSIQSVRIRGYVDSDPNGERARYTKTIGQRGRECLDWAWTAAGEYRYQTWGAGGDGIKDQLPEPTTTPRISRWSKLVPPSSGSLLFPPIAGYWVSKERAEMWFADAIEQSRRYKVVRRDGKAFVEFEIEHGSEVRNHLQVDPEHGFLPVRFLLGDDWQYDVDEWERLEGGRWSPKAGRFSRGMKTGKANDVEQWRIVSAEYNGSFPAEFFALPMYTPSPQPRTQDAVKPPSGRELNERVADRKWIVRTAFFVVGVGAVYLAIAFLRRRRNRGPTAADASNAPSGDR
jgi:hypothetical protein